MALAALLFKLIKN